MSSTFSVAHTHHLRSLIRLLIILISGILLGFMLLVAVYSLPVDRMEQNVLAFIPTLDGTWGTGEEGYEVVIKGYETAQLDNFTDVLMLLTAIHRSDADAVEQAINVSYYALDDPNATSFQALFEYGRGGEQLHSEPYGRYWLGFLVVLKPLLLFFTYMDIRMINAIVQGLLLLGIVMGMLRRGLTRYVMPFGLSMICLTPFVVWLSFQYSTVFYTMGISMLVLLWKPKWVQNRLGDTAFFMLTGMATGYFDFLTYPLVSFGMPFVLYLLMHEKDAPRALLLSLLRCGAAWCIGYGGMWAGKWLIAACLGHGELLEDAINSLAFRSSATDAAGQGINRMDAIKIVSSVFTKSTYYVIGFVIAVGYGIALIRSHIACRLGSACHAKPSLMLYVLLVTMALLPICWLLLTANHAYVHPFFTSRTLTVTAFALLCAAARLCECTPTPKSASDPPTPPGM